MFDTRITTWNNSPCLPGCGAEGVYLIVDFETISNLFCNLLSAQKSTIGCLIDGVRPGAGIAHHAHDEAGEFDRNI